MIVSVVLDGNTARRKDQSIGLINMNNHINPIIKEIEKRRLNLQELQYKFDFSFDVGRNKKMINVGKTSLTQGCSQLKTINLASCYRLTDASLAAIILRHPSPFGRIAIRYTLTLSRPK